MLKKLIELPRKPLLLLIRLYQKTLSPDHGPLKILFPHGYCKFQPTCSEYGYAAILKYGVFKGVPLTVWRILRCNPCSKGGVDELRITN
jgi:putative membrane protein insertion efficiency factor